MKLAIFCCLLIPAGLPAQNLKPETAQQFDCYIQSAEARMNARKAFMLADTDTALSDQIVRGQKIRTIEVNGPNPHKLAGGQVYDWIGAIFIPGATLDRLMRMLQDYDHRAQYFPETISTSKLLCMTGAGHFQYSMRMKEPAILDVESDVVWERVDPQRWRLRSVSRRVAEVGKDHGYLRRLNSYWRFAETPKGVFVEAETITLSDEFGAMTRALGSALMGINPEKSLKHSLTSMRESVLKPGLDIPKLPAGLPACGDPAPPAVCPVAPGTK
ncbi:MAG TPA: hypothetical protein VGZ73_07760 [Bryobacteraceae bacterium]|jgi:hypothetical protein|nr:hypothetical protein [Bryobacteraceae bacterium]